jgi:hypothetical protein
MTSDRRQPDLSRLSSAEVRYLAAVLEARDIDPPGADGRFAYGNRRLQKLSQLGNRHLVDAARSVQNRGILEDAGGIQGRLGAPRKALRLSDGVDPDTLRELLAKRGSPPMRAGKRK